MPWERRRYGRYYTRTRRVGGRFVRTYVGTGPVGEAAAAEDALRRAERKAEAEALRAAREHHAAAAAPLDDLCGLVDLLMKATLITYGSLVIQGGSGNPRTTFSYKSGGRSQSSRRRLCTSVNGDNSACIRPFTSTTLMLIVFSTSSSSSALGRSVWRPG